VERTAVVAGAGIAGLVAGHALKRLGYEVRVLERDAQLRSAGNGLTLWSNAVRALEELGLGAVVAESGRPLTEAMTVTPAGAVLTPVPLRRLAERFGPMVTVHRAELLAALEAHCEVEVEFGTEVSVVGGVLHAAGTPIEADLIVGADGINSAVRATIAPEAVPRPAGYGAWRGVAPTGEATPRGASEALGPGRRFGLVPMSGDRTYWFAVIAGGDGSDDLEAAFAGWHPPIAEVLAATPPERRSYLPLHDLPRLRRWHRGHTVLVGDAAHAMTPNLGQGAAQALEDLAVLAEQLRARPLPEALRAYEAVRKRRAERIARESRLVGGIVQISNPRLANLRDFAARCTPQAISYWQMARVLGSRRTLSL
jgi:2-polyprenyl-6-methoxyphenol hydroxylase-like FAD-dependent oxidoreductase